MKLFEIFNPKFLFINYEGHHVKNEKNSIYVIVCIDVNLTLALMGISYSSHVGHIFEKYVDKNYNKECKRLAQISNDDDLEQQMLPVVAARLVEWINDCKKTKLLKLIRMKLAIIKI